VTVNKLNKRKKNSHFHLKMSFIVSDDPILFHSISIKILVAVCSDGGSYGGKIKLLAIIICVVQTRCTFSNEIKLIYLHKLETIMWVDILI
jgi:hypothetical protein